MNVRIEEREPVTVVYLRHVGPYAEVGGIWGQLCGLAGPQGLLGPQCQMLGLSYDDPAITPPDKLRYDACFTVPADTKVQPPLAVQEVPGGPFALAIHEGPYEDLSATYDVLYGDWLPRSGREPRSAPCVEVYLNDPTTTAPADLRTEVWIPVTEVKG